ncbi:MAG TPA: hypothetical protein VFU43_27470 [Streptosporangiaceae bacterium]|nr:hypothetical protein [Streptosporangiaceae bacterium]
MTDETGLAGSYQFNTTYNLDGTMQGTSYPAAGGMTAESVTYGYDDVHRPITTTGSGSQPYVTDTLYSNTGKPMQYELSNGGKNQQL